MKLSTAMMLGSTTCEMKYGDWNSCGLGAAANALGMPESDGNSSWDNVRLVAMFKEWPWIAPHEMTTWGVPRGAKYFGGEIALRFDRDVCSLGRMTFEQLVDYVASIEPSCGECNRFECTCEASPVPVNELVAEVA